MKKIIINNNLILPNRYILAPMAGLSDYSLRRMCYLEGVGLTYTEMVSCESVIHNSSATFFDLKTTHLEKKKNLLALQIFGGKKESILKSIPVIEKEARYDILDFNAGCPVNKVVKQNAGSKWLTKVDELTNLMKDIVNISSHPVSIKLRTGFNEEIDLVALAKRLEEVGVSLIAIHGRTRKEFFFGKVNYDIIKKVKENVTIPVIANGGISLSNASEVLSFTKADGIMIGQKALGHPEIFSNLIRLEEGKEIINLSPKEKINQLKKHLKLLFSYLDENRGVSLARGISTHYIKDFKYSAKLRSYFVRCKSKKEYFDLIKNYKNYLVETT